MPSARRDARTRQPGRKTKRKPAPARLAPAAQDDWFSNRYDRISLAVLVAVALVAALTFRDYGLGWDDYTHSQYADLLLSLFSSGFQDKRAFSFVNLYYYGGGFDVAAALLAKILPFGLFETRRLAGAIVGLIGLAVTWRLARRLGGPSAGLIALVLLAACPLYYGHMFINAKDAPFAVAMTVLLLTFVRALDEYPQPSRFTVALLGLGFGLAIGSRVLALTAALYAFPALLLLLVVGVREQGWRAAAAQMTRFAVSLLPGLLIAYLIMGLLWPWSVLTLQNPLLASEYFSNFFEKPWREMYAGKLYSVPDMPVSYLPHLFALKLPEIMLALGVAGAILAFALAARSDTSRNRRSALLAVALAPFLPIAMAMVMRPALYNGLRHFIFVVPPFAVLGGLAGAYALDWLRPRVAAFAAAFAIFAASLALPVSDMIRLHPFQYTAFNWVSGGVQMAQDNYMLDYWGLAFKQASEALRAKLAEMKLTPPGGRRWIVEICGPQRPAEVALGPQFQTTWDRKRADFAMMLGTYYCRDLRAPVLVEVEREGVDYALVYDIRGRPVPNLLTEPPP